MKQIQIAAVKPMLFVSLWLVAVYLIQGANVKQINMVSSHSSVINSSPRL
jgi:hypothetical protein